MNETAVTISHISKQYGTKHDTITALDDISLTVERGSFYGLLGSNGAGKTTLIGILGGLIIPSSGSGTVLGHDIIGETLTVRKHIGIVPQEAVYDPFLKVREALIFQSKYYGIHDNGVWIDTLLEKLQLQDKVNTNTRALSGGMKRRLMIAQALVHKPSVIVLDEPTAGVDINLRLALWQFIRELNENGHTIILTTHYLEEAEALCKQVALMNHGKVVAQGSTRSLLAASTYAAILHVRANGGNPAAFPTADSQANGSNLYRIHNYNDIEPLLAAYRQAGADIEEITVTPPKLEDVFVKIMQAT